MKQFISFFLLFFCLSAGINAQSNFTGIAKYKLSVTGSEDKNTDSMAVVFDTGRVMIILYIPDSNKVTQQVFIDDFKEMKSLRIDRIKQGFKVDSLKMTGIYDFVNTNSIGAVNNELCLRYKANLTESNKASVSSAECLAGINFMTSAVKNYFFLGVQPIIIDNRIVMDYTVNQANGSKPRITIYDIKKLDNVDSYFDLWGYREIK